MKKIITLIIMLFTITLTAQEYSQALEDNSFFIEEAYNQEDGVFQHIFQGIYERDNHFELSFSEEMPVFNQLHQFSFELSYLALNSGTIKGVGDLTLQYRYQLAGKENWAAVSPAVAIIIPLGSRGNDLGTDNTGYSLNIPISRRLSEYFTAHLNAGITHFPEFNRGDYNESMNEFFIGGSLIWLADSNLNFLLEYILNHSNPAEINNYSTEQMIVPGIRYAINIGSLQIVPAAAAVFLSDDKTSLEQYVFYLSFEHPL